MKIIVTGGLGYIGSHVVVNLLQENHEVMIIDDLSNSTIEVLAAIKQVTNKNPTLKVASLSDKTSIVEYFRQFCPDAVMHFAASKSVEQSVLNPLEYYENNVSNTLKLLQCMSETNCKKIIFSSSATVYGNPQVIPITEKHRVSPINPYGETKLIGERLISNWVGSFEGSRAIALRYFNPVGAHASGLIGENPKDIPANLMPYILDVASGKRPVLTIFGDTYDTNDGTGVRDYVHVLDVAEAHVHSLYALFKLEGFEVFNIGVGRGVSVKELIHIFEEVTGQCVNTQIGDLRQGDVAECWADSSKFFEFTGWTPKYTVEDMCKSAWDFKICFEKIHQV